MKPKNQSANLKQYIALGLALLILIVVGAFAINSLAPRDESQTPAINNETAASEDTAGSEEANSYITYKATTDGSALDQLEAMNDSVVVEESDLGKYVESINGFVGGTEGKYWSFYVDGKLAEVGADTYKLNGGELIEWKFQKL